MTDQQNKIYKIILKREVMTAKAVGTALGISEEQAYADLELLERKKLVDTAMITDFRDQQHRVKVYRSPLFEDEIKSDTFFN